MNKLVRVDDLKQVIKQHDMLAPVYRHELGRHCCNDQLANVVSGLRLNLAPALLTLARGR